MPLILTHLGPHGRADYMARDLPDPAIHNTPISTPLTLWVWDMSTSPITVLSSTTRAWGVVYTSGLKGFINPQTRDTHATRH